MNDPCAFLEHVLGYELHGAERYRRFVAVVRVGSSVKGETLARHLAGSMRKSDAYVWLDHGVEVLMSETSEQGALAAVHRYAAAAEGSTELRFGIAAYPRDGHEPKSLLELALLRLEDAKQGASGEAVWRGHECDVHIPNDGVGVEQPA